MGTTVRNIVLILIFLTLVIFDCFFVQSINAAERCSDSSSTPFGTFAISFFFNLVGIVVIGIFILDSQNRLSAKVVEIAWNLAVGILFLGPFCILALAAASSFGCYD